MSALLFRSSFRSLFLHLTCTSRRCFCLILLVCLKLTVCQHPAEEALQGRWNGHSVENFEEQSIAAATGWARGTQFEFRGNDLTITMPAKESRKGKYKLAKIEGRQVTLAVQDQKGELTRLDLIVDDAESLRWMLDDGRTLVLKKEE